MGSSRQLSSSANAGVRPLLQRRFDLFMVAFFLMHIPVTAIVDSQIVLPRDWYPAWARDLLNWYLSTFNDPLIKQGQPWFVSLCYTEVYLQFPFFFVGAYAFAFAREWVRPGAVVYGFCTATTLVPILAEILTSNDHSFNKAILCGFYLPFLVVPLAIGFRALSRPLLFQPPTKESFKIL
ncbi:hypothetical protein WJX73_006992 [Symbiochloris irregularis]|uniref:EXPERA domain-containing protein n=1 Tax=Symbiochloris irregularis TaxID=706552 RepID=A0AAW1NRJ8_9CHLO